MKVRNFPQTPGVYLMKDTAGRVIYVGKAKNLRSRAGSYFLKAAADDRRTADLVREIHDIEFLEAESEVDALLVEARLVKDIQPKFNQELKDDKTFPYLEIYTREDFPRVEFTRQPQDRGTRLYGPFASAGGLRGAIQVLQKIFKFRTCSLDINDGDEKWRWYRPWCVAGAALHRPEWIFAAFFLSLASLFVWLLTGGRKSGPFTPGSDIPVLVLALLLGPFWFLVFLANRASVDRRAKRFSNSGLAISPAGLALAQADIIGHLRWAELKKTRMATGSLFSRPTLNLYVQGAVIQILDIYDSPISIIHEQIDQYWQAG